MSATAADLTSSSAGAAAHEGHERAVSKKKDKTTSKRKRSKSLSNPNRQDGTTRQESLGSAIVRALVGSLAFLFKRPIRLFRPVKLSSWAILEAMAKREGRTFGLRYLRSVIKRENRSFLPHLLGPPLLVNTLIGFTLFEAYSLTEAKLLRDRSKRLGQEVNQDAPPATERRKPTWTPLWIVTVSGMAAGAAQCFISAPLDNVRYILQRNVGSGGGKDQRSAPRRVKEISWRAVFRAAVLPFAPAIARDKLVEDMHQAAAASDAKRQDAKGQKMTAAETRKLWEMRLKRWRGGIHGAGLFLSLIRDSVGFGSFFCIFEVSRRCAFYSSISIDKAFAWINARGLGTVRSGDSLRYGDGGPMRSDGEGDVHIEGSMRDMVREGQRGVKDADFSYNQSRTVQGRIVAVVILLIGGALGALTYELVGRPFELMRVVIWEGRKEWEEDMRKQDQRQRHSTRKASARARSSPAPSTAEAPAGSTASNAEAPFALQRGRSAVVGARCSASQDPLRLATSGRLGNLVSLRAQNSGGTRASRLSSYTRLRGPRHPLRLVNAAARRRLGVPNVATTRSPSKTAASKRPRRSRLVLTTGRHHGHAAHHTVKEDEADHAPRQARRPSASLATRPSSIGLLIDHARKIAKVDQRFGGPDPATTSVPLLLYHTYFVSPFLPAIPRRIVDNETMRNLASPGSEGARDKAVPTSGTIAGIDASSITTAAQRTLLMSIASRRRSAFRPEEKVRKTWINNNPVNSSFAPSSRPPSPPPSAATGNRQWNVLKDGARRWGQGRAAWALRRLCTPWGVAFVVMAYMTGGVD